MTQVTRLERQDTCRSCGTSGQRLYRALRDGLHLVDGVWNLDRCPACGFIWLNPRPAAEEVPRLYRGYHTHSPERQVRGAPTLRRAVRDEILHISLGYTSRTALRLAYVLGRIAARVWTLRDLAAASVMYLPSRLSGRLLDVGCGNGSFMAAMRAMGWDVAGIDPDPEAVRIAREAYGVDAHIGLLEESVFPPDSFDAVTLKHVLEHSAEPAQLLTACRSVIRPDGVIVVTTPNAESLGHRVFRGHWRGLEVPRHFHVFSPFSLMRLAEQAGLVVRQLFSSSRTARWMWLASRMSSEASPPSRVATLAGVAFHVVEEVVRLSWLWAGEELVLVAGKMSRAAEERCPT